jgi:hypothetical protein
VRGGEPQVVAYWNSDGVLIGVNAITGVVLWRYTDQTAAAQIKAKWQAEDESAQVIKPSSRYRVRWLPIY